MSNRSPEGSPNTQPEAKPSKIESKALPKPSVSSPSPQSQRKTSKKSASQERLNRLTVGQLGEDLVADWIQAQGGKVLEQRWHCRRGELDIVALMRGPSAGRQTILAFIEVKTRSRGNWDAGGLLAITPSKQRKLWHSAQTYLAQHPNHAALACRFDVALVRCQKNNHRKSKSKPKPAEKPVPAQTAQSPDSQSGARGEPSGPQEPALGQARPPSSTDFWVKHNGYHLTLQHYLTNAFQLD